MNVLMVLSVSAAQSLVPRDLVMVDVVRAPRLQAEHAFHQLTVKFHDAARARVGDDGQVYFLGAVPVAQAAALQELAAMWGVTFRPQITLSASAIAQLEARAAASSGRAQPDLAGMMVVEVDGDAGELEALGEALRALPMVERAHITEAFPEPPADIDPVTPDYTEQQDYLGSSIGIDAEYVWDLGIDGSGLRVTDIEYGWNPEHEEFADLNTELESGQTIPQVIYDYGYDSHGTAVWGEIGADNGSYGVTGGAHGVQLAGYLEYSNEEGYRRPTAILSAAADSAVGDLILLEMQVTGPGGDYGPAELDPDVWDAVRLAVDAGVVVVAAAGNGNQDLDSSDYSTYRSWGDSGAIIVGAGSADSAHDCLYFSTHGTRVDVQGFGEQVFTTGYGYYAELSGDKNQRYIDSFNGTSSASPIVTVAAALLQHAALELSGEPLTSEEIRDILIDTGTAQGSGGEIGPLPNVPAAIAALAEQHPLLISIESPEEIYEGELPELTYTLESKNLGVTFAWTLDDGTKLTAFPDDGAYTVLLTATDDFGRSAEDALDITVLNAAPTLEVTNTTEPVEGWTFTIRSASADVAADTVTVTWWLDGEAIATGESADLTFGDDGTHELLVVASDEDGGETRWTEMLTVANADPTIIDVSGDAAEAGVTTTLTVSARDVEADTLSASWDFGDGESGEGLSSAHTYSAEGSYTAVVTVTDDDGGSATAELTVDVSAAPASKESGGSCSTAAAAPQLGMLLGLFVAGRRRRTPRRDA